MGIWRTNENQLTTLLYNDSMAIIEPSQLSVILSGPYLSHSGFSKTNRELAFRLARKGVKVKADICESKVEVDQKTADEVNRLARTQVPAGTPIVYSMTMPPIISHDGPKILFTMMESSKGLHQEYCEKLDLASEIWVPTTHMSDLLGEAGVRTPVHLVPLGVDHNVFGPKSGQMTLPNTARSFRFLSVSWWGPRKGFDILIKAFVMEFFDSDDVCLVISSRDHGGKPASYIATEIDNIVKSTGKEDRAPIILHSKITTDRELASLYNACNVFVLASKGEGYSLPIVEAASCGLPVISTRCTAQETYLEDSNSYLLDPEGFAKADPRDGRTSNVGRWCKFYENQLFPIFSSKSVKMLGGLMRDSYEDRATAAAKASILTEKVRTRMTWDHATEVFIERLAAVHNKQKGKKQ